MSEVEPEFESDKESQLYKFEYWEWDADGDGLDHISAWQTAESAESLRDQDPENYTSNPDKVIKVSVRLATEDEAGAYMDGFSEGAMMAAFQSRMENYNGVMYELKKLGKGADGGLDIETEKTFICGVCDNRIDFLDAAMAGDYYVCTSKDTAALWHVCKECA